MGTRNRTNMALYHRLNLAIGVMLLIAASSLVYANPIGDSVVPESTFIEDQDPESTFIEDQDPTIMAQVQQARAEYQLLQSQGNDDEACESLANAAINDVSTDVEQDQNIMNALSDGSECEGKADDHVEKAKTSLLAKKETATDKKDALDTASSAPIEFPKYNLDTLQQDKCDDFFQSQVYKDAVKVRDEAKEEHDQAVADLNAATEAEENAEDESIKIKNECLCAAKTAFDSAWKGMKDKIEDNVKAWNKGQRIKCAIANTSSCDVPEPPAVTAKQLVTAAADIACDSEGNPEDTDNSEGNPEDTDNSGSCDDYQQTAYGSKCAQGAHLVNTEAECRKAGELMGKTWDRADYWGHIQPGCVVYGEYIYFNKDAEGTTHHKMATVCTEHC